MPIFHQESLSIGAKLLKLGLLLVLSLVARTLYLLNSVRRIRKRKDPRTHPLFSPKTALPKKRPLKTLVVLGSGGHTTEMLHLIRNLDPSRYNGPMVLVVATTDTTSLQRVVAYPHVLPIQKDSLLLQDNNSSTVFRIPRSREVGQSYSSSILTTLYSFLFAVWLVGVKVQPDLVLVNGPGTCLPIAVSAFFFRVVGWKPDTTIVFVESFCRVTSLSLTGKLLYPIADLFVVCWEQLHEKYPLTYLTTSFIAKTNSRKTKR